MKQIIARLIAMVHRRSFLFLSLLLVPSLTIIPAIFLLDRQGRIIGDDLRGEALEEALTKALTNTR